MNSSFQNVLNRLCEEVQQQMKLIKENEIHWETNTEVLFFLAMIGYKPVGVNRHFMMLLIHNKFSSFIKHEISSKLLWDHLDSLYDMAALNESEIIPFPNEEVDYELPEDCLDLLQSKCGVSLKPSSSETELTKNSESSKAVKKLGTPKIKQSTTPVPPKTTFATPVPSKPQKSQNAVKNENKTPTSEGTPKTKQDSGSSTKTNKIKRSSSPFSNKTPKPDSTPGSKQDTSEMSSSKKVKPERSSSPTTTRKPTKSDSNVSNSASKKAGKGEATNTSRSVKEHAPESSTKKVKTDKDVSNKKSKTGHSSDNSSLSKKSVKSENINGIKKRSESDSTPKKASEASSVKQAKSEVKHSVQSSRGHDSETPPPSGSRKSSPIVKVKTSDSSKKLKRPRSEESSKKITAGAKRRRIT